MTKHLESIEAKYIKLKELLNKYSEQYYCLNQSQISDAEYDNLYKELEEIEIKFPELIDKTSPTQKIGAVTSKNFSKIQHTQQMLSLENAFNEEDISNFIDRLKKLIGLTELELILEPKFDGLSASLHYTNGKLALAATRGDGFIGEDVTANALLIESIPQEITAKNTHIPNLLEIRGEVVMLKKDFYKLNKDRSEKEEKLFANPRNAASGSLRQQNAQITKDRCLTFFAYTVISDKLTCTSQQEILIFLKNCNFLVSDKIKLCKSQNEAYEFYKFMEMQRADLEYDIDGIVYKLNDLALQKKLGASAKYPRHSVAYKFPAEKAQTTILDIKTQIGRGGTITPVAELKPVNIGGVVVSRATLHNKDEIEKKDIRIGDRVILQRAGDVIPQILSVLLNVRPSDSTPFIFPSECPCCGTKLVKEAREVSVKCQNYWNCKSQIIERLIHFVSKQAFNIVGLGEQNIKFLYDNKFITNAIDIFTLERATLDKLNEYNGWGAKSIDNLLISINESTNISLDKLIYALAIPQVGVSISKIIAKFFSSYKNFITCILNKEIYKIAAIFGIGESITEDINNFFTHKNNLELLIKLAGDGGIISGVIKVQDIDNDVIESVISGKTIVFTGTFEHFSRDEAKTLAKKHGAKTSGSVSNKTSFVVAGNNAGSKLKNAQTLGIIVISEEDFMKMINSINIIATS